MKNTITATQIEQLVTLKTQRIFGIKPEDATQKQIYKALCLVVRDILTEKRVNYKQKIKKQDVKQVYYMSMEFLLGRSLKNHLFNLGILEEARTAIKSLGSNIDNLLEIEPDAGLGNGGLGRLAAAYMDSLTSLNYCATGFSIKYEYGIFAQKIVDGWQTEMPDRWLEDGEVWLAPRVDDTFKVNFGGRVEEEWTESGLKTRLVNCSTVLAVPYDMHVSGYDAIAVNTLRLWSAKAPEEFDMNLFSRGEYVKAMENKAIAETISKVLYPADDHYEGKSLRLKQQYFFVSASIQSIIKKHLKRNKDLSNLGDKVSIHINDTHPALCIPELMRILLDVYGYSWDDAWAIVGKTVSYTNHTVMSEALERWPLGLFSTLLPRITQIVNEINQRFCADLWREFPSNWDKVSENAIMSHNEVRMANLCVAASHTVNGVSVLHSNILKEDIFKDYYRMMPYKFTNVTNGITYRRWVAQANPELHKLLVKTVGEGYMHDSRMLNKLMDKKGDKQVLSELERIKRANKVRLAEYVKRANGVELNPDSIFDVQVKRLHEYKRQLLNALHIIDLYLRLKENPDLDIVPRTFIFGAKAAPSYYMAKQVIRLICTLGDVINNDKSIKGKLKVVFIENYRVTLAELIMPAAEVSEQISIAGKEASGTGNMKFMVNGAITMGTMDGANVEIHECVGDENIFIFGLRTDEVNAIRAKGYNPTYYYNTNPDIKRVIDALREGFGGESFREIADSLLFGRVPDPYMALADFADYKEAQNRLDQAYRDRDRWNRMSLVNIARAGFFSSDRSVEEYCDKIWDMQPVRNEEI
ncbi:MAG: glycogen/starch/alpha-glucan phosphorylase [Clostridia bacterium]|nr:glycogen/starch/alpha-glucan phosphorylase [Clostridia bacterium]